MEMIKFEFPRPSECTECPLHFETLCCALPKKGSQAVGAPDGIPDYCPLMGKNAKK